MSLLMVLNYLQNWWLKFLLILVHWQTWVYMVTNKVRECLVVYLKLVLLVMITNSSLLHMIFTETESLPLEKTKWTLILDSLLTSYLVKILMISQRTMLTEHSSILFTLKLLVCIPFIVINWLKIGPFKLLLTYLTSKTWKLISNHLTKPLVKVINLLLKFSMNISTILLWISTNKLLKFNILMKTWPLYWSTLLDLITFYGMLMLLLKAQVLRNSLLY